MITLVIPISCDILDHNVYQFQYFLISYLIVFLNTLSTDWGGLPVGMSVHDRSGRSPILIDVSEYLENYYLEKKFQTKVVGFYKNHLMVNFIITLGSRFRINQGSGRFFQWEFPFFTPEIALSEYFTFRCVPNMRSIWSHHNLRIKNILFRKNIYHEINTFWSWYYTRC